MRTLGLSLAFVVLAAASQAQPPAGPGTPAGPTPSDQLDPARNRLDHLLIQWEQRMKSVESLYIKQVVRTETDKVAGLQKTYVGEARYLRPNYAALQLVKRNPDGTFSKDVYELYVSTGQFLYEYRPQSKQVMVHEISKPNGGFEDNFLAFLFGMKAADAKRRYDLRLTKEDANYIYMMIRPMNASDKAEFTQAQLVLFTKSMLPCRLWFEHPNGNQVTWDLPDVDTTARLTPQHFTAPDMSPQGWKYVKIPRAQPMPAQPTGRPAGGVIPAPGSGDQPPRVVRPQQK